jgi:hypothetical protein
MIKNQSKDISKTKILNSHVRTPQPGAHGEAISVSPIAVSCVEILV